MTRTALAAAVAAVSSAIILPARSASAARALGVDVSHYQEVDSWATVQAAGISFVFMKATEGTSYTDPYYNFRDTAIRANSTLLFSPYHFARPDSNTAVAEANYFYSVAAKSMKAGNLLPVLDLEDGGLTTPTATSRATLTAWATAFSDRIYALAGVRPIIYVSGDYARNQLNTGVNSLDLWYANPDYQVSSALNNFDATSNYGVWNGVPNAKGGSPTAAEWSFWQYNWNGEVAGIDGIAAGQGIKANTASNLDLDVANGDIEYVKKFKIPAIYQSDADGAFGTTSLWNTTTNTLPLTTDRIVIDRASANPLVTVATSARVGQSLDLGDRLAITSGSLTLGEYAVLRGNTTISGTGKLAVGTSITNSAALSVSGGTLTAASLANASTFGVTGGATTIAGAISGVGTTNVGGGTLAAASITQASLAVSASGTATVTGALTTTAGTTVTGGTLNVGSTPSGTLAVTGTGAANFTGNGASKLTSLTVAAATADLGVGLAEIAIDYTAGNSPLVALRDATRVGAIASNKAIAGTTGVGMIEATAKFSSFAVAPTYSDGTNAGVLVDATTTLLALALFGDTNFSGTVDLVDLTALAAKFLQAGNWQNGDSTYDGIVNQADLALLGGNYGKTLLANGTVTGGNPAQFALDVGLFANLPEPMSLASLSVLAVALRRRRR